LSRKVPSRWMLFRTEFATASLNRGSSALLANGCTCTDRPPAVWPPTGPSRYAQPPSNATKTSRAARWSDGFRRFPLPLHSKRLKPSLPRPAFRIALTLLLLPRPFIDRLNPHQSQLPKFRLRVFLIRIVIVDPRRLPPMFLLIILRNIETPACLLRLE